MTHLYLRCQMYLKVYRNSLWATIAHTAFNDAWMLKEEKKEGWGGRGGKTHISLYIL